MTCRCDAGFVCEDHPEQPHAHDPACGGAGMQCPSPVCPYWHGDQPLALNPAVRFDQVYASSHLPERTAPMLKTDAPRRRRRRAIES